MADTLQQRVARQIELAFGDTPYPTEPLVGSDGEALATALQGQRWQDVSHDILYRFRWDMFLLTPAGFRYFAPAMMRAAILASGRPVALDTKGEVRDARGFTSRI